MSDTLRFRTVAAVAAALIAGATSTPARAQDRAPEVVAVIQAMFDAMTASDTAGMRARMHPEARIVQTGNRDGTPFHRVNTIDAFLSSIGGAIAQGRTLEEKIFDPDVKVEDNLAHVWVRYEFYLDGQLSHCGVDSNQVIRTTDGWKILQIVDTQRRPCR